MTTTNDAYILVRGDITVVAAPATQLAFKNCAPFTKCITKVDETTIDDAEWRFRFSHANVPFNRL